MITGRDEEVASAFFNAAEQLFQVSRGEALSRVSEWYTTIVNPLQQISTIALAMAPLSGQQRIEFINKLHLILKSFTPPAQHFSRNSLTTPILKKTYRTSGLKNDRVICPIDPDKFINIASDSYRVKYLKFSSGFEYHVKKSIKAITAILTKKKTPVMRRFNGTGLLRAYFTLPFEKIVLDEWNRFNRAATDVFASVNGFLDDHASDTVVSESADDHRIALALQALIDTQNGIEQRILPNLETLIGSVHTLLDIAGTPLFPNKTFTPKIVRAAHRRFGRQFIKDRDAWRKHWQGVIMDQLKDTDLLRLEDEINIAQAATWKSIETELAEKTYSLSEQLQLVLTTMKKSAATTDRTSRQQVRSFLVAERKQFSGTIADQYLTPLSEIVISFDLDRLLDIFKSNIKSAAENLQERYVVFTVSDHEHLIPESQFDMVPLRELFLRFFTSSIVDKFELIADDTRNNLITYSNQPVVLGEIVETTFDTAYMELRKKSDDDTNGESSEKALKEFSDGIDRALSSQDVMQAQLVTAIAELKTGITQTGILMQEYLNDLRRSEKLIALKLKLVRSRATEQLSGYREKATALVSSGGKALYYRSKKTVRSLWRPILHLIRSFSQATRLDIRSSQKDYSSVETYLKLAQNSLESLPAVYRRAFRFESLDAEKLLISREAELSLIATAYNEWHSGKTGLIALTGERGSGRSTLARIARLRYFNDIPVARITPAGTLFTDADLTVFLCKSLGIEDVDSLEKLEELVAESEDYRVLIVEDIHHIFQRTISGLQIFKRFLLFASRTQKTIFWILTCGGYTWKYLDKVLGLQRYFSLVVNIAGLLADDIEELITRRHRLCGIPLHFSVDPTIARSKKYRQCKNKKEQQALLQKIFFKKLTDASTGNVSVAMLFWCISIKNSDNKMFEIVGLPDINLRIETVVSTEELFIIAAIVLHERMSPVELANVLSMPPETALLHLTGLKNKGFIIETKGFFELHFFLYRSFIGYLHEKRLLH